MKVKILIYPFLVLVNHFHQLLHKVKQPNNNSNKNLIIHVNYMPLSLHSVIDEQSTTSLACEDGQVTLTSVPTRSLCSSVTLAPTPTKSAPTSIFRFSGTESQLSSPVSSHTSPVAPPFSPVAPHLSPAAPQFSPVSHQPGNSSLSSQQVQSPSEGAELHKVHTIPRPPTLFGMKLVGDNIDWTIHPRFIRTDQQTHLFTTSIAMP